MAPSAADDVPRTTLGHAYPFEHSESPCPPPFPLARWTEAVPRDFRPRIVAPIIGQLFAQAVGTGAIRPLEIGLHLGDRSISAGEDVVGQFPSRKNVVRQLPAHLIA
jgi:hypothetical protein